MCPKNVPLQVLLLEPNEFLEPVVIKFRTGVAEDHCQLILDTRNVFRLYISTISGCHLCRIEIYYTPHPVPPACIVFYGSKYENRIVL